jgi:APA family basic amino acid/polyamine antiporter
MFCFDVSGRSALQEIATAQSDRGCSSLRNIFWAIGTLYCSDDYDFDFVVTTDWLWLVPEYYTMAQDGVFFKKAAQLNKASVPEWSIWAQCFGLRLCVWQGIWWFTWFCGDHSFDFYILTILGIFILRKKMPDAERPYRALDIRFTGTTYRQCNLYCPLYTKTSTSGWCCDYAIGIPVYYLTKAKE